MQTTRLFNIVSAILLTVLVGSIGCACHNNNQTETAAQEEQETDSLMCSCPHALICIQPYDNFTKQEANKILPSLEKNFGEWLYGGWTFRILDPKPLPPESHVKVYGGDRYRASTILQSLQKNPQKENGIDVVYIGLTHKDICADVHHVENYGIIGLSFSPGNVCVVSDKRLKSKSIVWKPMLHEFMHAFFGAKHCPNDDPHCFMKDAKGKGNFEIQNKLCDSCRI